MRKGDAELLARGAVEVLPAGELERKLALGRPLRVKFGIDPTAPDIHLGHTVVLRKLRAFQDAGHLVVLIIGDFTARLGDPSGRSELRPILSVEQIEENALTYQEQAFHVLDRDPARLELRHNSEWLDMDMTALLALVRTTTVAQLMERDDFVKRHARNEPVSVLELLYPLMQGYDSVAVRADIELGGTDQTFNLLLGRDIQRAYGQPEQAILTMPLLVGIDGRDKMSKSLGNDIGVSDPASEIYGRTMRIDDELLGSYFALLLGRELPAGLGPRDAKRLLAHDLVAEFHGADAADAAEHEWDQVFVNQGEPDDIDEAVVSGADSVVHMPAVLAELFGMSRSEARRLITSGGVYLDDQPIEDVDVSTDRLDGSVLRVGRRKYRRLRVQA
ncbi:MAG: tyrosine--tRNA ligase [Solirubrobacteraceae bacterium]